ncbi:MAG: phosphoribosyltransferase [Deltaproteobacteria bacterium]|nr:phosphoribosyltransferase [Deltaproteobacteria bacterium]
MIKTPKQYADRVEAGRMLAQHLRTYAEDRPVVVGLPRGGVVVAAEAARELGCELDVIVAGKLRAPGNPELAIGAVTEDGLVFLNYSLIRSLHIRNDYIEEEKRQRLEAVRVRLASYRAIKKKAPLNGRTVILADDGLATGATMMSAIQAVKAENAAKICVAVPGGPADTVNTIMEMGGITEVICPIIPAVFYAVSQLYMDFNQVEDAEVVAILKEFAAKERI